MKSKSNQQVQPPEVLFLRNQQAQEELLAFQIAVDSYLERASREPGITFHQHLSSFFATARECHENRCNRQ